MAEAQDEEAGDDADGVRDGGGATGSKRVGGAREGIFQQGISQQRNDRVGAVEETGTRDRGFGIEINRNGFGDAFEDETLLEDLRQVGREEAESSAFPWLQG